MVAEPVVAPLRFQLLGPVRGWREGVELDLGPAKQRAVLALLLLHRGAPVPPPRIVDAVWGDEPPMNGANVVQKYVAGLRREIEPARAPRAPGHLLALDDAGYSLAVADDQVDAALFERLVRSGLRHRDEGRPGQALTTLREAVDLVAGEPLSGLPGAWFEAARRRLAERRLDAVEACVELEVALGRAEAVLPEVRALVAEHPLRERLRGALMLALYRSGRPAEALAAFQEAREHLAETLGADPGPALQELHRRVLDGDPALGTPGGRLAAVRPAQEQGAAGTPPPVAASARPTPDDVVPAPPAPPVAALRPVAVPGSLPLPLPRPPAPTAATGMTPLRAVLLATGCLVVLASFGLLVGPMFAVLAVLRDAADRRRLLAWGAAYAVVDLAALGVMATDADGTTVRAAVAFVVGLGTLIGAFVHAGIEVTRLPRAS